MDFDFETAHPEPTPIPATDGRNLDPGLADAAGAIPADRPVSILAAGLSKFYDNKPAVDGLDLAVREGEFYGFLGPNGAGKSTTIRMLCGLLQPDRGGARIAGYDLVTEPLKVKASIGVLPEEPSLYERLTGQEFLMFSGQMYGLTKDEVASRAENLLNIMELTEVKDKLIVDYSMGMKKKVALAAAILHGPKVLFLDEPFNGIDPVSVRAIRDVMRSLTDRGTTIFISSHVMEVIEKLCTRVAIINRGKMVGEGSLEEMREMAGSDSSTSLEDVFLTLIGARVGSDSLNWLR